MKVNQTYQLAKKWQKVTKTDLRHFVDIMLDGEVVPNTSALEDWLQPEYNESISEALERKYGKTAVEIITKLFEL